MYSVRSIHYIMHIGYTIDCNLRIYITNLQKNSGSYTNYSVREGDERVNYAGKERVGVVKVFWLDYADES